MCFQVPLSIVTYLHLEGGLFVSSPVILADLPSYVFPVSSTVACEHLGPPDCEAALVIGWVSWSDARSPAEMSAHDRLLDAQFFQPTGHGVEVYVLLGQYHTSYLMLHLRIVLAAAPLGFRKRPQPEYIMIDATNVTKQYIQDVTLCFCQCAWVCLPCRLALDVSGSRRSFNDTLREKGAPNPPKTNKALDAGSFAASVQQGLSFIVRRTDELWHGLIARSCSTHGSHKSG